MPLFHSSSSRRGPEPTRGERREQRGKMVFSRPLRALSEMRMPRIVLDLQPSGSPRSPIKLFFRIRPNSIPNQTHPLITLVYTRQLEGNTLPQHDNPLTENLQAQSSTDTCRHMSPQVRAWTAIRGLRTVALMRARARNRYFRTKT